MASIHPVFHVSLLKKCISDPEFILPKDNLSYEEVSVQILENMFRDCIIDFKGNWDKHLLLVEFAYNNSFYISISIAPYEALYSRRCRSPIGWFEVGES